jgi:cytochrome o ubiquinol oxidase subunit 1
MTMRRVPLFAWSALIGALGMLLALPVVFGAIVYLFLDHRYAQLNFGGSEGIAAWIGWAFSVPIVAVFALPAVGFAAETIPITFKARPAMRGVAFGGIALVGVTALAAATQQFVHAVTIDTTGQEFLEGAVPMLIFTGLPLLGLLIVMALGALTAKNGLSDGRPRISAPFVFGFLGLGMIAVGIVGNLLQSITDLELVGTTFEEGATLYVVDGTALAVMGGCCPTSRCYRWRSSACSARSWRRCRSTSPGSSTRPVVSRPTTPTSRRSCRSARSRARRSGPSCR